MKTTEKFFVVISNNGNHIGHHRTWRLVDTFYTEKEAEEKVNELLEEDGEQGDMNSGLTVCKVANEQEVEEMKEAGNRLINF